MDELQLSQLDTRDERDSTPAKESTTQTEDVLGLDTNIKLTKRLKIARLDNERIFNEQTGLKYIIRNHRQLLKSINKADANLQKKYQNKSKIPHSARLEHEYDNLSTVLQFYQLWCHGLFPKANFKDCIHLLRSLGAKSSQLRIYRRQLIEAEINKLKIEKGIIDDVPLINRLEPDGENQNDEGSTSTDQTSNVQNSTTDDDWSFMNRNSSESAPVSRPSNGLFLDEDDDDLYHTPTTDISKPAQSLSTNTKSTSDDDFSDDDDQYVSINNTKDGEADSYPEEQASEVQPEDEENEMDLMREFGM
ncbi:replication fork protection component Swi3-domain-containing protein [Scheffersomyces coipomensis]|uniref:replication fork protection component Swi3-domain-containing protein n=1 Tax=Scheffersomyces coipomensis TaxID=1788519 RepID=UPI00315D7DB7